MEKTYTTKQVVEMTGLSAHTLRYYEKIGLLMDVKRNSNGYRTYTDKDLAWIDFLMKLRATGMPISNMKTFSDLRNEGDHTAKERRKLLEEHEQTSLAHLRECQKHLEIIAEKMVYYKDLEEKHRSRVSSQPDLI